MKRVIERVVKDTEFYSKIEVGFGKKSRGFSL